MPCKLLIKNRLRVGDVGNDESRVTLPGSVVAVVPIATPLGRREDKRVWIASGGSAETWNNDFVVLEVSDLDYNRAVAMMSPEYSNLVGPENEQLVTHKYRWNINIASLPAPVQTALSTVGAAVTTYAAISTLIRRRRDNTVFDPDAVTPRAGASR